MPRLLHAAIGIALSGREVGLAVADRERVSTFKILNLRKVHSHEGRHARFRQVVAELLERHPTLPLLVVVPDGHHADHRDISAEHAWLLALDRPHVPVTSTALRTRLTGPAKPPSTRALAEHLAGEYPELWSHAPSADPNPGSDVLPELAARPRRVRTARERYWSRAFLALAAVRAHLDDQVLADAATESTYAS